MLSINHFVHGWGIPAFAFILSVTGSVLALRCASHARISRRPGGWLAASAVALGGCGIWVMHFTAMMGFGIQGVIIRFDIPMTALSAVIAVVVVWAGLSIVVRWQREVVALPLGGVLTGLGVAAMHYLGMFAMHTSAHIEYKRTLVALSIVIAIVAATAALWLILHVRGIVATVIAGLVMGFAVCGMHYTAMASMHAHHADYTAMVTGVESTSLLMPLMLTVSVVMMSLMLLVGLAEIEAPTRRELHSLERDSPAHWPMNKPGSGESRPLTDQTVTRTGTGRRRRLAQ
ncbi:MHYT domain-containing protein [Nocardia sp. NPDC059246]|uniref:MHYT domain-containing protein n=1 Tax=unclassified Nocardia TaxID=2637762 RepID=UPI0036D135AB